MSARRRRRRLASPPIARPARPCTRCSRTRRRSSKGSRSTRRSSTSRGLERIAGTPVEIAARLRRDIRDRVGLPITVGVARTKFLAKVASGVAKPDGLLVVPARQRAGVPSPTAGGAALGRRAGHRREAPRAAVSSPSARSRSRARRARVDARACVGPAPPRPRAQPRSPAGPDAAAGGGRSGRSGRSGVGATPGRSMPCVVGLVDRVTRRMRAARSRRPHRRASPAFRRLLPRDSLAHPAEATAETQTILAAVRAAARRRRCR